MKQAIKIRELKQKLKDNQSKMEEHINNLDVKREAELPEEEQQKNKEAFRDGLAILRADQKALKEELKITRMNKTGSEYFEWIPHVGLNRRQARNFAKLRRQNKLKRNE